MRIIRERQPQVINHRPDDELLLREVAQERCGQCWDRWASSQMTTEDGYRRCPDCVDITTKERDAAILAHDSAQIAAKQTKPQVSITPLYEVEPAFIRKMENAAGARITQANPLVLVRSGSAVTLTITGGDFASTDTFTYSTGISDDSAPSLTGSTVWTLSLVASGSATPGDNNLTFNNHTYRGILRVG